MAVSTPDLQEIHDFLISIAQKAGEMITAANPTTASSGSKKNSADLVTETDQAVETMVSKALMSKYPSFKFLGEETYQPGTVLTAEPTFVVDPIDGTVNFVHGHPYVSISLALCINLVPMVGVVYNPFTSTLYSAIRGQGSYLNRTRRLPLKARPEPLRGLNNALVAVEWGSDRRGNNWDVKINTFANLGCQDGAMVHSMRSLGSAALNFCGVAAGTLDMYWEAGCWAWDVAAGWVILEEAGGIVADANPGGWHPRVDGRRYMAVRNLGPAANGTNGINGANGTNGTNRYHAEHGDAKSVTVTGKSQKAMVEEFWTHVAGRFEYEL
ncbi:MAG: hypothetical protein M1838_000879 [Thelocarpon superellum]|nr:MAG: hypothetical protein M1838_000879 [Thelocarpon superellum]